MDAVTIEFEKDFGLLSFVAVVYCAELQRLPIRPELNIIATHNSCGLRIWALIRFVSPDVPNLSISLELDFGIVNM